MASLYRIVYTASQVVDSCMQIIKQSILWFLSSARHVVEEEKDVKRAMEFLHECDLLKIEDILPFFHDFVTIDHFKVHHNYAYTLAIRPSAGQ